MESRHTAPVSLGLRTDVRLLEMTGSTVEDRGSHLVVRTPANPGYYWGNFLLLRDLPVAGGEREVVGAFQTEFPDAGHVAIAVDVTTDRSEALAPFREAGLADDSCVVMTAGTVVEPRPPASEVTIRPLDSDQDWAGWTRLGELDGPDTEDFRTFVRARDERERTLVAAGHGRRYAAFDGDEPVSSAAVFLTGDGVARFQTVQTRADRRRERLAANVVHAAATYALAELGASTLVIVAEPEGPAGSVYARLGFGEVERQTQLLRHPA